MQAARILKHLFVPDWMVRRAFASRTLQAIEHAIAASERKHQGEVRFVVEGGLDLGMLWRGLTARDRAEQVFSQLRVWDTEHNSGVLVYLQYADRRVEILADRGINARVAPGTWDVVCGRMELAYRAGRYESGALAALDEITQLLVQHFPAAERNPNELSDRPVIL